MTRHKRVSCDLIRSQDLDKTASLKEAKLWGRRADGTQVNATLMCL